MKFRSFFLVSRSTHFTAKIFKSKKKNKKKTKTTMANKIVFTIVKIWIMMFYLSGGVFSKTSDADNSGSGSGNSDGECSGKTKLSENSLI